jgi:hypothetical protein
VSQVIALIWERLTRELAESSPFDFLIKLLAGLILLALIYLVQNLLLRLWRWARPHITAWWRTRKELLERWNPNCWLSS